MKRNKLKLQLNRETLATLDRKNLRAAGGDCTCTACTNCTCCPTCASCGNSCTCLPETETCFSCTCTQNNDSNCICA